MDDAQLNGSVGIDSLNRFGETLQPIDAGAIKMSCTPRFLSSVDDLQPELGAFGLGDPEAEGLPPLAGQIDADGQIHRLTRT